MDRGPDFSPAAARTPAPRIDPGGIAANGSYRVLLDARGRGESVSGPWRLTGGRGALQGLRIQLRDLGNGRWWRLGERTAAGEPAAAGPTPAGPVQHRLESSPGEVRLHHQAEGLQTVVTTWVDAERPAELRSVSIRNDGDHTRRIEVTTYVEVVLHDRAAHDAHPVFSKLFLQTEWAPSHALLVHRRPRGFAESFPWLVHAMLNAPVTEFETDRLRWLGRGRPANAPAALSTMDPLTGTVGNVLDPALSLRTVVELPPGESRSLLLLLGTGPDREGALGLVDALSASRAHERSRLDAIAHEQARLATHQMSVDDASRLQALAVAIAAGQPSLRATPPAGKRPGREQPPAPLPSDIAPHEPLIFLDATLFPQALAGTLRAHAYWRSLGFPFQLVVATSSGTAATEPARAEGVQWVEANSPQLGGVESLASWAHWAHWAVTDEGWPGPSIDSATEAAPPAMPPRVEEPGPWQAEEPLWFANEHGGFAPRGDEYVVRSGRRDDGSWSRPPLPWINVIANPRIGSLWSETGAGCTWSGNSREHRLTPWLNDPVLDPHSEALHVRDDDGSFWSVWPGPTPAGSHYEVRHGFGYTRCVHRSHGLDHEATVFVPVDDPVRLMLLRLRNLEDRPRHLSVFHHADLVLGTTPEVTARAVVTEHDARGERLLATRPSADSDAGVAFAAAATDASATWRGSSSRSAYLGPEEDLACPRTLAESRDLSPDREDRGDPCFTQQLRFTLGPGEQTTVGWILGEAATRGELETLLARHRSVRSIEDALEKTRAAWRKRLETVEISTPSKALDLMINGWLTYQTVACRLWARSAFYQSGGAYGFRDQLQDAVALTTIWPQVAREQILLHAAHQFVEGDVLHWWHPPRSRGLRTRFADDLLWLPYLTSHYLQVTGDRAVLDEPIRYLRARALEEGEDEAFLTPEDAGESGPLFEHCLRAIDRSLSVGAHGLPLFGCGDWNDGMNRVGREGRGESVWMGFFLFDILEAWATLCDERRDASRASLYRTHRERLREALEDAGWDGQWYRRGYYDDGAPLGSRESDECQIDALAQAWSVLSGAASLERAEMALDAMRRRLVDEEEGILRLLTPPFQDTPHDPGYIKGYVAGVRENGGQYTHAALWAVRAFAERGHRDTAMRLLDMLNPIHHARDDEHVKRYKVEPYVVAADVYGVAPHVGRGGWTWYTGSSGWMLRVAMESILGVRVEAGRRLVVDPRIPDAWPGYRVRLRPLAGSTRYDIDVRNPDHGAETVVALRLDGRNVPTVAGRAVVELSDDGGVHHLVVVLGRVESQAPPLECEGVLS